MLMWLVALLVLGGSDLPRPPESKPFEGGPLLVRRWADINSSSLQFAEEKLEQLKKEGDSGSGRRADVFKNARLDDPLYYFATEGAAVRYFATDPSDDLMPYFAWRDVMYPVISGEDAVGLVRLRAMPHQPVAQFIPVPSGIYEQFKKAVRRVRLDGDQQLSVATAGAAGDYFLIEDGITIYKMAPCTTRTLLLLGLNNQHIEDLNFIEPKDMGPMIKRAMRGGE